MDTQKRGTMDTQKWQNCEWTSETYAEFRTEALASLEEYLADVNMVLVKVLPTSYYLSAVISNADNTKWIHLVTRDVRKPENWAEGVSLRRMSSERDWKGKLFHYCAWDGLGAALAKYMTDEFDNDIFFDD